MTKLPLHGRDHRPEGADPIPGLVLGGGGGGIDFDIENSGNWLHVTASQTTAWYQGAILFTIPTGGFRVDADEGVYLGTGQSGSALYNTRAELVLAKHPAGPGGLSDAELRGDEVYLSGNETHVGQVSGKLRFYSAGTGTAVAQPAHPVTLADVIAALTALGLVAP